MSIPQAHVKAMLEALTQSLIVTNDETTWTNSSEHLQTASPNASIRGDCIRAVVSEMEYLPWDNPDNIVSAEVKDVARKIQINTLGLLFLIGGPANVINMAVFYKQGLKDRINLCLFALSLNDLIFLIYAMFALGEQLHMQFTTNERFGPVNKFVNNNHLSGFGGSGYVSGILSAIIATERCVCVFCPLKFQRLFRTRTMAVIVIVIYIVVLGLFFIVVFRYRVGCMYDPTSGRVVTSLVEGTVYKAHKKFIDSLDTIIFGGALPGTVLTVVTTTTTLTIIKLRQIVKWRSETSSSMSTGELALTKMLVVNSILFVVCFSPEALNHLTRHFIPGMRSGGRHHNFFLTVLWLGDTFLYFNATLNIFVYYAMGSHYRQTFWSLFGREFRSRKTLTKESSPNTTKTKPPNTQTKF